MTKQQKLRSKIRTLIREILGEDDVDSATIKYTKPQEVDSATIKEPVKHEPSSVTIKEKRGYTQQELLKLLKKSKDGSIDVHVHGQALSITDADQLDGTASGFGLDQNGNEREFNYANVEFVNVGGKRV